MRAWTLVVSYHYDGVDESEDRFNKVYFDRDEADKAAKSGVGWHEAVIGIEIDTSELTSAILASNID